MAEVVVAREAWVAKVVKEVLVEVVEAVERVAKAARERGHRRVVWKAQDPETRCARRVKTCGKRVGRTERKEEAEVVLSRCSKLELSPYPLLPLL